MLILSIIAKFGTQNIYYLAIPLTSKTLLTLSIIAKIAKQVYIA
jgi:hypothetical protein